MRVFMILLVITIFTTCTVGIIAAIHMTVSLPAKACITIFFLVLTIRALVVLINTILVKSNK